MGRRDRWVAAIALGLPTGLAAGLLLGLLPWSSLGDLSVTDWMILGGMAGIPWGVLVDRWGL
jgi:hypothetical protein